LSYRYQIIKPDDAIYQKLFELFDLKPQECLFFDDKKENIDGAVRNGMNGHVFVGYEDAMETIRKSQEE
jgi:HAD superfamily hydrolase (TIGR01509 family)